MLLFISYDLATEARPDGFPDLEKALNDHSSALRRTGYSQWLLDTPDDVATWGTRLASLLNAADRVVIVRVPTAASVNGWLPKADWEWISEHAG